MIGSDVWELSSLLRGAGLQPTTPRGRRFYPAHYRSAVQQTDLLIQPAIPTAGFVPGAAAVERLVAVGERATHQSLARRLEAEIA